MLAVSFKPNCNRSWSEVIIKDSLNYRLLPSPSAPKPVVICELSKRHLPDTRFYVELRTPDDKKRLLALNGQRIECSGCPLWPTIEPWDLPSSSSTSNRSDGYRDSSSRTTHQQHEKTHQSNRHGIHEHSDRSTRDGDDIFRPPRHQEKTHQSNRHDIHEHSDRSTRDSDNIFRPPKRPRTPTSGSPSSKRTTLDIHKTIGSLSIPNIHASKYKVLLTKKPPSYTPRSFKDYLNNHIKATKMVGASELDKPSIVTCYESSTSNTCDGWILEARTAKIADSIVNHLSGKLLLSGTRLFFQQISNSSSQRPLASPRASSYPENGNGKIRSSSSLPKPDWANEELHVYSYDMHKMAPSSISLKELSSFINSFMKKTGLFDRDVVVDTSLLKSGNVCRLLCISGDAAQKVVDELHDVRYPNSKNQTLRLARHNSVQKQTGDAAGDNSIDKSQADNETKKKAMAPSNAIRRVSVTTTGANDSTKTSSPATDTESAKLKAQNQSLTKQVMTLLKENKFLKRENEKLTKEVGSGSQKEPIVLPDSSELEALNVKEAKRDKELAALKDACEKLKEQAAKATKEGVEYRKSLIDVHADWVRQTLQNNELQKTIKQLKDEQRKENLEMSQALRVGTTMLHEERAVTKQMQNDIIELRKGKKRAQKELRDLKRSLNSEVKRDEDKYDA